MDPDGRTYSVCDSDGKNCSNIDDKIFEAEQKQDQANGVNYSKGTISDSDGAKQGTYSHDSDIAGNPAANIAAMGNIGNRGISAIKYFVAGSVVGGTLGAGALALSGSGAAATLSLNIVNTALVAAATLAAGGKVGQQMAYMGAASPAGVLEFAKNTMTTAI